MSLIPDYSRYDLSQLHDMLRSEELAELPELREALRQEIEFRQSRSNSRRKTAFWVPTWEATPMLWLVRILVGLECIVGLAALINWQVYATHDNNATLAMGGFLFLTAFALCGGMGVFLHV